MTEQPSPRRPLSEKVAGIRHLMQSAEARRADDAREAAADVADAQQDVIVALNAAGINVAPPQPLADRTTVGFSCSPETARILASWVRQHADGPR